MITKTVLSALQILLLGVALCSLSTGCATAWSEHGVVLDSRRARIAVLPVEDAVPIKRLGDICTLPEDHTASTNDQTMLRRAMGETTRRIEHRIEAGLDRSYFFQSVQHEQVVNISQNLGIPIEERTLSPDQLTTLGHALDADAVLLVTLSGYGKIKKKWFYLLIGSGLVEGTVQGVAAAAVVDNPWVAVGVAAEEFLQEAVTWGGGTYFFNRKFTPVIIEAKLVSSADGETIWTHTSFARLHRKALKKLPEAERGKKEVRLELTAERAIDDLLEHMDKKAFKNITYRQLEIDPTVKGSLPARGI